MGIELEGQEEKAIASLKRLSRKWPKSLWLFSASGTLHVMKTAPDGTRVHLGNGSMDPDYAVTEIAISNDGGDW